MLKGMRKNAKRVLWPLTILIIIGMGGWGSWYFFQEAQLSNKNKPGSIRGKDVTPAEYQRAEAEAWLFGKLTNRDLKKDELIPLTWRRLLLSTEAARLGITATREELIRFIASLPIFQYRGRFSRQLYQRILSAWRINELTFEAQMKHLLAIEKLKDTIQRSALVSPAQVDELYRRAREEVSISYVEITGKEFPEPVEIAEEELKEFYRKNPALFTFPTRVKIEYLLLPRERFRKKAKVTPEEVDQALEERSAEFTGTTQPGSREKRRAALRDELLEKKIDAEVARVSDEVDRMLIDVNDLDQVAKKYSADLTVTGFFSAGEKTWTGKRSGRRPPPGT